MLRRVLRNRFLLPGAVLATVGLGGLLGMAGGLGGSGPAAASPVSPGASSGPSTALTAATTAGATSGTGIPATSRPGATRFRNIPPTPATATGCQRSADEIGYTGPKNSGSPSNSTPSYLRCVDGQVTQYGNSAIVYKVPPASYIKPGEALFDEYCSSCHMPNAEGSAAAPPLVGVGPATVDFWVSTGRMPAATPLTVQATAKPPRLTDRQAEEIAAFINSLSPAAPYIPTVNLKGANLTKGLDLFALNCAACHTITGAGDALAYSTFAPSLHYATPQQVAEAVRTGPGNMPRFTGNLTDTQVRDIVAYVTQELAHATNPGGFGLGGIGPVAEGFVALLFGVGGFMLVAFWIGDRA